MSAEFGPDPFLCLICDQDARGLAVCLLSLECLKTMQFLEWLDGGKCGLRGFRDTGVIFRG